MVNMLCLITLLSIVFQATSLRYYCNNRDLSFCFSDAKIQAIGNAPREISIVLLPHIKTYELTSDLKVDGNYTLFEIIGNDTKRTTVTRKNNTRLVFLDIDEVNLKKISFKEEKGNSQDIFFPFLTINQSKSIIIEECQFHQILGNALSIYIHDFNKDFNLSVNNSNFFGTGNAERPSQGVYLRLENTRNANVKVIGSSFSSLKINDKSKILTGHQRILYRPLAFEQSRNDDPNFHKSFTVSHCDFVDNDAYVGGGLGIYTSSTSNSFYKITHSYFRGNRVVRQYIARAEKDIDVSGSGGGIAALLFNCANCTLGVYNSKFVKNTAALGGGIKMGYYFRSPQVSITISNTKFLSNSANSGSGLYIEAQLVHPAIPQHAILRSLFFLNNFASDFGAGIFVAYLPLRLEGKEIKFVGNSNTAFSVISSQIDVYANLNFTENTGSRGGALFLSDNSQLLLDQKVNLVFVKNRATDKGGAIYADSISLDLLYRNYGYTFYNVHCFIKHFINFSSLIPENYTQNILFKENDAPIGSVIYTHTLSPCSWYSNVNPYSNISHALRWPTYTYKDNGGKSNHTEIATSVAHYYINNSSKTYAEIRNEIYTGENKNTHVQLNVVPGQASPVFFSAYDQLGFREVSIATVQPDSDLVSPCNDQGDKSIFLTSSSTAENPVEISFCGKPGTSGNVSFKALDGLTIERKISILLTECPEGQFWNQTSQKCSRYSIGKEVSPLWECNMNTSIYSWSPTETNNTFVTISCPPNYCEFDASQESSGKLCNAETGGKCAKGRVGIGCSSCAPHYTMQSGSLECTHKCNSKRASISTVLLIFLLLVIVSVLFLIRSSSYLDKPPIHLRETLFPYARSFIFFCQGTFILYLNTFLDKDKGKAKKEALSSFVTKTGFFFTYDSCFTFGFDTSRGRVFEEYFFYLIGFVAIFVFSLIANCILSRCLPIRFKASVIAYTFVSYSFLTYTPIAFTSLKLLSCGKLTVYSSTLGTISDHYKTWYYDAAQTCYGSNADILISSVAFLVLFLYIIPLPIIYLLLALYGKKYNGSEPAAKSSKFNHVLQFLNKISSGYLSSFPESLFGFWIPITMLVYLVLLAIQTNGPLFGIRSDKQAQLMAVICFFFLYFRASLKISKDLFLQLYDAFSNFFLCISCIFLIIYDNVNEKDSMNVYGKLIQYFPLAAYIFLFIAILLFPIVKHFFGKSIAQENGENEEKPAPALHVPTSKPTQDEEIEICEPDDIKASLLSHDHLDQNSQFQVSLPYNRGYTPPLPIPINDQDQSYQSIYHSSGTPGEVGDGLFDNQNSLSNLQLSMNVDMRD